MRRQLETAQEELYKMEKERDESHLKVEELEKRLEESQAKEAEMSKVADQARSLKVNIISKQGKTHHRPHHGAVFALSPS